MKLRTLIAIIAIIIIAAGIIFYFLFHQGSMTAATPGQTGTLPGATTQTFPGASSQSVSSATTSTPASIFGIVANGPVLSYGIDQDNNVFIIQPNGQVEMVSNGQTSIISSLVITNIISASFSNDAKRLLVNSGDPANPTTSVLDLGAKAWLSLPQGMQSPVWGPAGYQIAYITDSNPSSETISIATLTGTSTKVSETSLATITMQDSLLQWPNKNTLIIADKASAYSVASALSLNISAKALTPAIFEYPAMTALWSPATSGIELVFAGSAGYQGGSLSLLDSAGDQKLINFITLPSKCAFNEDVSTSTETITTATSSKHLIAASTTITLSTTTLDLYCAVPRDQQTLSIARLPDEYDQKMLFTADDFYEIGVASGTLSTIFADPNQTLDATDLKIANNTLLFINRYDQKLYGIKLSSGQ